MESTDSGSPKKRKGNAATDVVRPDVATGGAQLGLVTLHKKPRVYKEEEEECDGTESTTTVSSMKVGSLVDAPPSQQRLPRPEANNDGDDRGGAEVVVELTSVAELVKKGGSGMLVRRPALGHRLAVFWRCDRPYVVNDACPHRGAPLSEGDIEDLVVDDEREEAEEEEEEARCPALRGVDKVVPHVVCPLHYYKYDLTSGRCYEGGDWSESLMTYETWVEGDSVMARLPRLPPISDDDDSDNDDHDDTR